MSGETLDARSFELGRHVGEIDAWCEAVAAGAKPMCLSAPFASEDCGVLLPYMEAASARNGVRFWLEKELCATDLFGAIDMTALWVFIIYGNREVLDRYRDMKREITQAERTGRYTKAVRREMARRFGRLLGYSEAVLDRKLTTSEGDCTGEEERS